MFKELSPIPQIEKTLGVRTKRLAILSQASLRPMFSEINVVGRQNLENLPKGRPIIFATTHLSNTDLTIAASELAKKYNIKIATASTHDSLAQSPSGYISKIIGGSKSFISIGTEKIGGKEKGIFRPKDYDPMVEHLKDGPILMAAYYNSDRKYVDNVLQKDVILPERGGVGAIWLAQKSNAVIVPTTIDVNNRTATIHFGEFLDMKKIEEIDEFKNDLGISREIIRELRTQSDLLMSSLAEMLPPEKRGKWEN